MEPLWEGQESLIKVAKFGQFPRTILYKSCLFYPSWQATSFERPPFWVAFVEGFHCIWDWQSFVIIIYLYQPYSSGGRFKNNFELINLEARKVVHINKLHIFQSMGKIFCVEFQREPIHWKFKSSQIYELVNISDTPPPPRSLIYETRVTKAPSIKSLWPKQNGCAIFVLLIRSLFLRVEYLLTMSQHWFR